MFRQIIPVQAHELQNNYPPLYYYYPYCFQFGVSLIVIFVIQLAIGIYAVVNFSDEGIINTLDNIFMTHNPHTIEIFESLQNSVRIKTRRIPIGYINLWKGASKTPEFVIITESSKFLSYQSQLRQNCQNITLFLRFWPCFFSVVPTDASNDFFVWFQLDCCGVRGQADYGLNGWEVPDTCCVYVYCKDHAYWATGCADALRDWTINAGKILGGVAIGLSIVEVRD